jgi:hypothetical protein
LDAKNHFDVKVRLKGECLSASWAVDFANRRDKPKPLVAVNLSLSLFLSLLSVHKDLALLCKSDIGRDQRKRWDEMTYILV